MGGNICGARRLPSDDVVCERTWYTENTSEVTFAGENKFLLKIISRELAPRRT